MAVHNGQQRVLPDFLNRSASPQRDKGMHHVQDDGDSDDDVPLAVRKQLLASSSQTPSSKSASVNKSNNHSELDVPKRNGESTNTSQSAAAKTKSDKSKDSKTSLSVSNSATASHSKDDGKRNVKVEPASPTKSGAPDRTKKNDSVKDKSNHKDDKRDSSASHSKRPEDKSKKDVKSDKADIDKKEKHHHDETSSKKKDKHKHEDADDRKPARKSDMTDIKRSDVKHSKKSASKRKAKSEDEGDDDSDAGEAAAQPAKKRTKKGEEEGTVWRWWEEKREDDSAKWRTLEHRGPVFPPPYEPLPPEVHFKYNGEVMKLSSEAEEAMTFYARMLDHEYTTKKVFNDNFFNDWKKTMTREERERIRHLSKCDMSEVAAYFKQQSEARKQLTKEEKQKLKEETERLRQIYGTCILDGHKEFIGNWKIEPPGVFRGRGSHPKMGMLKRRVQPEDVIINCSKGSKIPEPPAGHKWKEVRHDNTVTWLACWQENVQKNFKYVMLNAASKLKGEKDWNKYETARRLHQHIDRIRKEYRADWKHQEMARRQRGVALYFIDKLALRAGNEKDEDEADTVGCCSLRVEHVQLFDEHDGKQYVVQFDFLGKDSIRYFNEVPVEKKVFKNLKHFIANKKPENDLFDRLTTSSLNEYLKSLMPGLTAKVFRTYNASITLEQQLELLTQEEQSVADKILAYNRANRAVAILCNHQRSVPKTFQKSMENLESKIAEKKAKVKEAKHEAKKAKAVYKSRKTSASRAEFEKKKKIYKRLDEQLHKLELSRTDKDEGKTIALSTSKLNYLDPRISIAWCKKWEIPIEKVYNKTQRDKFRWAIEMATAEFSFANN